MEIEDVAGNKLIGFIIMKTQCNEVEVELVSDRKSEGSKSKNRKKDMNGYSKGEKSKTGKVNHVLEANLAL